MPRLRLLAVFSLLLAARPSAAAPSEADILKGAESLVAACPAAGRPDADCKELARVHAGYLSLLKIAKLCLNSHCSVDSLDGVFRADQAWDEAEHKLPDAARSDATGRPLLRLSIVISERLALALALTDPSAKPPMRYDPPVDAPRAVEAACLEAPMTSCAEARKALADAQTLQSILKTCDAKPCAFPVLDHASETAEHAVGAYFRIHGAGADLLTVFSIIKDAETKIAGLVAADAARRAAQLDRGLGKLDAGLDAAAKGGGADPAALEGQVAELTGLFREASLGQDRVEGLLSGGKAPSQRERLNAAAGRLAAARSRVLALEIARGLEPGSATAGAAMAASAGLAAGSAAKGEALLSAKAPPTAGELIDRRTIPAPAPLHGEAPPILPKSPGFFGILKNLRSKDPVARADARRRMGLSETIGDPSGRAALVHKQAFDDTCAIVSQQEVLAALRLLPTGDPVKQEAALRQEALSRGFYNQGTPGHYTADLLVDRGVLVAKKENAPLSDLDAAVRRGGLVIANVDARYLWGVPGDHVFGHAIVITGAEIEGGRTVGYYVNDSGSNPEGHGRFVPIQKFEQAWNHHTRSYAEVR
jgi:hypothetical protein